MSQREIPEIEKTSNFYEAMKHISQLKKIGLFISVEIIRQEIEERKEKMGSHFNSWIKDKYNLKNGSIETMPTSLIISLLYDSDCQPNLREHLFRSIEFLCTKLNILHKYFNNFSDYQLAKGLLSYWQEIETKERYYFSNKHNGKNPKKNLEDREEVHKKTEHIFIGQALYKPEVFVEQVKKNIPEIHSKDREIDVDFITKLGLQFHLKKNNPHLQNAFFTWFWKNIEYFCRFLPMHNPSAVEALMDRIEKKWKPMLQKKIQEKTKNRTWEILETIG